MLVTPSSIVTRVISVPHGLKLSSIAPLPEMVSSVPSSVQVQAPVVPDVPDAGAALALNSPTGIITAKTVSVSSTLSRDRNVLRFVMLCSSLMHKSCWEYYTRICDICQQFIDCSASA